ncbi:hypothetical protein M427DRAFT_138257 [Gonapodya prolifera JEL478]|uniref:Uncharacterized protein n=1 Tax=Gonapodya prolifera (strain JEL478) TaxID=1344416 RepID=A0A139A3V6_GONPJ|nr:hypothetical protein M427DRAFT_138257 [Gonapodya prolifera JEL478]|eukprot:KXS11482.1 hypothetical protein M427DRAFT_138257 [Gonapodya prolifera JEL478]
MSHLISQRAQLPQDTVVADAGAPEFYLPPAAAPVGHEFQGNEGRHLADANHGLARPLRQSASPLVPNSGDVHAEVTPFGLFPGLNRHTLSSDMRFVGHSQELRNPSFYPSHQETLPPRQPSYDCARRSSYGGSPSFLAGGDSFQTTRSQPQGNGSLQSTGFYISPSLRYQAPSIPPRPALSHPTHHPQRSPQLRPVLNSMSFDPGIRRSSAQFSFILPPRPAHSGYGHQSTLPVQPFTGQIPPYISALLEKQLAAAAAIAASLGTGALWTSAEVDKRDPTIGRSPAQIFQGARAASLVLGSPNPAVSDAKPKLAPASTGTKRGRADSDTPSAPETIKRQNFSGSPASSVSKFELAFPVSSGTSDSLLCPPTPSTLPLPYIPTHSSLNPHTQLGTSPGGIFGHQAFRPSAAPAPQKDQSMMAATGPETLRNPNLPSMLPESLVSFDNADEFERNYLEGRDCFDDEGTERYLTEVFAEAPTPGSDGHNGAPQSPPAEPLTGGGTSLMARDAVENVLDGGDQLRSNFQARLDFARTRICRVPNHS